MAVAALRIYMLFSNDQINLSGVFNVLQNIGARGFNYYSEDQLTTVTITFATDDIRLQQIRDEFGSKVVDWSEHPAVLHDAAELDSAPLFWVTTTRTIADNAEVKRERHIDFASACPLCRTGAVEVATLILRETDIPANTSLFTTHELDTLVSDELAQHLRPVIGDSATLTQALRHPDLVPLPWWQVVPLMTLPPMSTASRGIIRTATGRRHPCPVCLRDGHFWSGDAVEIRYVATYLDLANLPDVARSWERLGYTNVDQPVEDMHLAPGLLIISQRLRRLIVAHGSPEIELYPIFATGTT